jgi:prevent-host-death family protein
MEISPSRPWRLQDAKARFSELVRLAQEAGPQRVTIRGKDAVVIIASKEFDRLCHPATGADLVRAMADPRVRDIDFEHSKPRPPVRDVNL